MKINLSLFHTLSVSIFFFETSDNRWPQGREGAPGLSLASVGTGWIFGGKAREE